MPKYSKAALAMIKKQMEAAKTCDHPKDQEHVLGFGVFCGKCKIRLRYVSKEEGERKIVEAFKQEVL